MAVLILPAEISTGFSSIAESNYSILPSSRSLPRIFEIVLFPGESGRILSMAASTGYPLSGLPTIRE
jgi:hypothetical protein